MIWPLVVAGTREGATCQVLGGGLSPGHRVRGGGAELPGDELELGHRNHRLLHQAVALHLESRDKSSRRAQEAIRQPFTPSQPLAHDVVPAPA